MLNWRIGDVTITRIVELETPIPYAPDSGLATLLETNHRISDEFLSHAGAPTAGHVRRDGSAFRFEVAQVPSE